MLCLQMTENLAKNSFYILSLDILILAVCHKNTPLVPISWAEILKNAYDNKVLQA